MDLSFLSNPWVQLIIGLLAVTAFILIIVFLIVPLFKKKSSEPVKLQPPGVTVNAVKTGDPKKELYIPADNCTFKNTMNEFINLRVTITPSAADDNNKQFVSKVKVTWKFGNTDWVTTTVTNKPSFPLAVTLVSKRDPSQNIVCGVEGEPMPINSLVIEYSLDNAIETFLPWVTKTFVYDNKIKSAFDSLKTGEVLPVNLQDLTNREAMASQAIPYRFTPKSGEPVTAVRVFTSGDNYNIKYPANSPTSHTVTMFKLPANLSGEYDGKVAFKNTDGKFLYFSGASIAFKDNWDDTTFFTIEMQ